MDKSVKPYAQALPVHRTLTSEYGKHSPAKEKTMPKERKKQGNPFKRGDTWTFIYYVTDPETGKRKQKWKGGYRTKKEAAAALRAKQAEVDAQSVSSWGDLPFKEYAEKFLKWKAPKVKANTLGAYRTALLHTESIDNIRMREISVEDLDRLEIKWKQQGIGATSRCIYHNRIRTIFNWAVTNDDIAKSPYRKFSKEPAKKRDSTTPTTEEIAQILKASEGTWLHIAIMLGVMLGLRRGEVLGLRYSDFDFKARTVSIQRQVTFAPKDDTWQAVEHTPKTQSSVRTIAVPEEIQRAIQEHMKNADNLNERVIDHTPSSLSHAYERLVHKLGINTRFHDLRHAFTNICMEKNVPVRFIADAFGHSDIQTTMNIYADTKEVRQVTAEAMDQFANVISKMISKDN